MPESGAGARVAVVTGGATGVGAATALELAQRGYRVAIVYSRSKTEADESVAACKAAGADAIAVQGDVADDAACRAAVAAAVARFGRVDILVNAAGTTQFVPLERSRRTEGRGLPEGLRRQRDRAVPDGARRRAASARERRRRDRQRVVGRQPERQRQLVFLRDLEGRAEHADARARAQSRAGDPRELRAARA